MIEQLAFPLKVPARVPMRPAEPIHRSAEIEGPYRWTASRAWAPGPTVLWVCLNPSIADGKRDDPTMLRMIGFSFRWGFGAMIVCNAYPFIASQPTELRAWKKTWDWKTYEGNGMRGWEFDKGSWSAFHHNIGVISKAVSCPEVTKVVAAWGNGVPDDDVDQLRSGVRKAVQTEEFGEVGIEIDWHCLGKTKSGAPVHPLARGRNRVPDDAVLKLWKRSRGNT